MIKLSIYILLSIITFSAYSNEIENISEYRYYQIDKDLPNGKGPFYAVYIKKNDPCIFIYNYRKDSTLRLCEMGESGLNLERDFPSIYPVEMKLFGGTFNFYVAAPWNEQECKIEFPENEVTCKSTGR